MTTRIKYQTLLAAILAVSIAACSSNQNPAPATAAQPGPPVQPQAAATANASSALGAVGAETVITFHGKIVSVDMATKQVTLKGPDGKNVTLTVNNPYNLKSLKAGDRYVAQYTEAIVIEGKAPSDKPPVATLKAGLWSAKPGETPGVVAAQQAHMVVIVSAIDVPDRRVTLKAPDGTTENIHVNNPEALQGVQIGDRIAITLTQTIAIALAPEAAGA